MPRHFICIRDKQKQLSKQNKYNPRKESHDMKLQLKAISLKKIFFIQFFSCSKDTVSEIVHSADLRE